MPAFKQDSVILTKSVAISGDLIGINNVSFYVNNDGKLALNDQNNNNTVFATEAFVNASTSGGSGISYAEVRGLTGQLATITLVADTSGVLQSNINAKVSANILRAEVSSISSGLNNNIDNFKTQVVGTTGVLNSRIIEISGGYAKLSSANVFTNRQSVNLGTTTIITPISSSGAINNYFETNIQNKSNGATASTDFVATSDTGTSSTNYIDLGINSSAYTGGVFGGPLDGYLYTSNGNLNIGTSSPTATVTFLAGGSSISANKVVSFSASGCTFNNKVFLTNTEHASGTNTGSLQLSGGIWVNGRSTFTNSIGLGVTPVNADGALQIYGSDKSAGIKFSQDLYLYKTPFTYNSLSIGTSGSSRFNFSLDEQYGQHSIRTTGTTKRWLSIGPQTTSLTLNDDGIMLWSGTKDVSASNDASLVLQGGMSINKKLNVNDSIAVGGSPPVPMPLYGIYISYGDVISIMETNSTAPSNGSITTSGGVGIGKNLSLGGYEYIQNIGSVPATPTNGGVMFVSGGALHFKGSSGTITKLAFA